MYHFLYCFYKILNKYCKCSLGKHKRLLSKTLLIPSFYIVVYLSCWKSSLRSSVIVGKIIGLLGIWSRPSQLPETTIQSILALSSRQVSFSKLHQLSCFFLWILGPFLLLFVYFRLHLFNLSCHITFFCLFILPVFILVFCCRSDVHKQTWS